MFFILTLEAKLYSHQIVHLVHFAKKQHIVLFAENAIGRCSRKYLREEQHFY